MCYTLSMEINASADNRSDNWHAGNSAVSNSGRVMSRGVMWVIFIVSMSVEIFQF